MIHEGKSFNNPEQQYYEKFSTVYTAFGLVTVLQFNWQTNSGKMIYSEFGTVINGMKYTATLKEAVLSDRQIKWLATYFIKKINSAVPYK